MSFLTRILYAQELPLFYSLVANPSFYILHTFSLYLSSVRSFCSSVLAFCHDCNSLQVETDCSCASEGQLDSQELLLGLFTLQGSLLQDSAKQTLNKPICVLLSSRAIILLLVLITSHRVLNSTVLTYLLPMLNSAFIGLAGLSNS